MSKYAFLDLLARASSLPAGISMIVHGNEEYLRQVGSFSRASVWGRVSMRKINERYSEAQVCWTASAIIKGMYISTSVSRRATAAEIGEVINWEFHERGARTGVLRHLVESER